MKSLLCAAVIVLAVVPRNASSATIRSSCFICDDYMGDHFVWHHNDYFLFLNDTQGTNHGSGAQGSCSTSSHSPYAKTPY